MSYRSVALGVHFPHEKTAGLASKKHWDLTLLLQRAMCLIGKFIAPYQGARSNRAGELIAGYAASCRAAGCDRVDCLRTG